MATTDNPNRRNFIKKTALGSMAALLGTKIVYALPENYTPVALEQDNDPGKLFGKHKDMIVLNNKPWNVESRAHLLDDAVTPADKMFIRNNGLIPEKIDPEKWTLTIKGEAITKEKTYTLQELKTKFPVHTYQLVLECGGNGRKEYYPPAKGNQWSLGAVSCAKWTGIRLKDLLKDAGINDNAVYVGYHGADKHISRDPNKQPISRGIPISKAMDDYTIIAFAMNGEDIPIAHGHPLRLIASGFPASVSGKWLEGLSIRDKVHDGEKMAAPSYSIPKLPVEPGAEVKNEDMKIIESMPVKSLVSYPKSGAIIKPNQALEIRGHAWTGAEHITKVEYSIDFGATWHACNLEKAANRYSWQHFKAKINFPQEGYYEVWAKATDNTGLSQPMVTPGWNPKGYLNNACHRIAIKVS
ncbi:sulfite oxidase [Cyclobacterium amurskyense]|jgi:DMSO/TMAO reductase YedYZ molybdopterin-dependent catalytic subunit|uniref:Oxidoreductase molybdopterin binding protein n=1 Tax=Cyclobacterium amurskyense TaxID=320787 RepID=A0A0H4P9V8_9BACT|nr:sulfite oxidase [Cyclobacterium amurskyense]AKP49935.1 Oxidoreductase molybdopterin binding protein [Cyclobacterium amurskyense]|tara:strand:+ start:245 stop:1480 length:1236 start_codon:yes stop_codon:yes gene_type:complete